MRCQPLSIAVLVLLTACGGGGSDPADLTDAGYQALGGGDYAAAAADFDQALAAISGDTSHPIYFRARIGSIEALSRTDAAKAKADFLALAKELPDKVNERHYSTIAGRMGDAGNFGEAVALLDAGKTSYPDSTLLDALGQKLVEQASKAGDSDALNALAGLGYAGD